jgi:hypothetical protein
MPLTPNFTASQVLGFPSNIVLTDTSAGDDPNVDSRRVYFYKSDGTTIVYPDNDLPYEEWWIALESIEFSDFLNKDYALYVLVQWLDVDEIILYSKYAYVGFTMYNETFDYQLTQVLAGNPLVINDNNFFPNKSKLRTLIDSGNQALEYGTDLVSAQICFDNATELRLSSQLVNERYY